MRDKPVSKIRPVFDIQQALKTGFRYEYFPRLSRRGLRVKFRWRTWLLLGRTITMRLAARDCVLSRRSKSWVLALSPALQTMIQAAAIINGITAAAVMSFMMLLASSRKVMGKFVVPVYCRFEDGAAPWLWHSLRSGCFCQAVSNGCCRPQGRRASSSLLDSQRSKMAANTGCGRWFLYTWRLQRSFGIKHGLFCKSRSKNARWSASGGTGHLELQRFIRSPWSLVHFSKHYNRCRR
jgi:hypothetical protein